MANDGCLLPAPVALINKISNDLPSLLDRQAYSFLPAVNPNPEAAVTAYLNNRSSRCRVLERSFKRAA